MCVCVCVCVSVRVSVCVCVSWKTHIPLQDTRRVLKCVSDENNRVNNDQLKLSSEPAICERLFNREPLRGAFPPLRFLGVGDLRVHVAVVVVVAEHDVPRQPRKSASSVPIHRCVGARGMSMRRA